VVRWESGVEGGSRITVAFDPLLAKVIAHAPTRAEAAATLALALERLHLGGVTTNRDFLAATLRHERFLAGDTTTDFIERFAPTRTLDLTDDELTFASTAGALWLQGENRATAGVLASVPSGWRNARLPRQSVVLRRGEKTVDVRYRARRDGSFDVGEHDVARVHHWSPRDIDVEVSGRRRSSRVTRSGAHLYIQVARGTVDFELVPRFVAPGVELAVGGLIAPMPGVVIEVRVVVGQHVVVGETLVVMEAMKMEHVISAPSAGVVGEVFVTAAQQVDSGTVLLTIDDEHAG
jgi:propionyl-CoA carboxylase alpha chain